MLSWTQKKFKLACARVAFFQFFPSHRIARISYHQAIIIMFAVVGRSGNPWEQLYDPKNQTYFYHNKMSGEFTRLVPGSAEAQSATIAATQEPLWKTTRDREGGVYWVDLETGYTTFQPPYNGTFVSEVPLSKFREATKLHKQGLDPNAAMNADKSKSMRRSSSAAMLMGFRRMSSRKMITN